MSFRFDFSASRIFGLLGFGVLSVPSFRVVACRVRTVGFRASGLSVLRFYGAFQDVSAPVSTVSSRGVGAPSLSHGPVAQTPPHVAPGSPYPYRCNIGASIVTYITLGGSLL